MCPWSVLLEYSWGGSKESLNCNLINHLHIFIIKEQPVIVALHNTDVVPMVGTTYWSDGGLRRDWRWDFCWVEKPACMVLQRVPKISSSNSVMALEKDQMKTIHMLLQGRYPFSLEEPSAEDLTSEASPMSKLFGRYLHPPVSLLWHYRSLANVTIFRIPVLILHHF